MKAQFLSAVIVGSFLLAAIEAKPKPDTIEILQNGANTEIVDFKPNGREEVIDINQNGWGGSNTYVREYSWYPNYYGYGNSYGYGNGYNNYYNNYNRGYYGNYYNNYNRGYGSYYGSYYGKK